MTICTGSKVRLKGIYSPEMLVTGWLPVSKQWECTFMRKNGKWEKTGFRGELLEMVTPIAIQDIPKPEK